MALLDELVQEEDLDPEVMGQSSSAFKNLPELEKIWRLIQMDLLEEPHLLRNMSDHYNLPLLSTTLIEDVNQFFLDSDLRFVEKQLNPLIKQLHVTPS